MMRVVYNGIAKRNQFRTIASTFESVNNCVITIRWFSDKNEDVQNTEEYLSTLGYKDARVQDGMKNALKAVFGNNVTVAHMKNFGNEGKK